MKYIKKENSLDFVIIYFVKDIKYKIIILKING